MKKKLTIFSSKKLSIKDRMIIAWWIIRGQKFYYTTKPSKLRYVISEKLIFQLP